MVERVTNIRQLMAQQKAQSQRVVQQEPSNNQQQEDYRYAVELSDKIRRGKFGVLYNVPPNIKELVREIRDGKAPPEIQQLAKDIAKARGYDLESFQVTRKAPQELPSWAIGTGARGGYLAQTPEGVKEVFPQTYATTTKKSSNTFFNNQMSSGVVSEAKQDVKNLVKERGVFGLGKDLIVGTYQAQLRYLSKAPTKQESLSLLFTPAFASGTAGESKYVFDYARNRFVKKEAVQSALDELAVYFESATRFPKKTIVGQESRNALKQRIDALLSNAQNPQQIQSLRKLSERLGGVRGRDLFDEAFIERFGVPKPRPLPKPTRDVPSTIESSGAITSQFVRPRSLYEGTGQYERTDFVSSPIPVLQQNKTDLLFNDRQKQAVNQLLGLRTKQRQDTILRTPSAEGFAQPQVPKQSQPQRLRNPGLLAQPNVLAQPSPQVPKFKQPQRPRTRGDVFFGFKPNLKSKSSSVMNVLNKVKGTKSWDVFVKRKGNYVKIADDLPRNRAEKKGADYVLRTLATRFKLVAQKKAPRIKTDINYEPNPQFFRDFLIRKGKRIKLDNEWIEKAGTRREPTSRRGARLGSRSEVSELLGFRNKKVNWFN